MNTRLGEIIQGQVVGADGAGADKLHLAAVEQSAVDLGYRTHQQHVGILDAGGIDRTPGVAADLAEAGKEGIEQRDILVSNNQHGALLSGCAV
ncbi:hypothetical protein D3C80_2033360 [compost metagenome]